MKSAALAVLLAFLALGAQARADFEPPIPVRTVAPDFPPEMRRQDISGVVTINCLVDAEGNVSDTKVLKATNTAFIKPALSALMRWKFKPAQKDGNLVPIRVNIPIKFIVGD